MITKCFSLHQLMLCSLTRYGYVRRRMKYGSRYLINHQAFVYNNEQTRIKISRWNSKISLVNSRTWQKIPWTNQYFWKEVKIIDRPRSMRALLFTDYWRPILDEVISITPSKGSKSTNKNSSRSKMTSWQSRITFLRAEIFF